jgi:8-oxo-dGTP pyrophosphatase MutT (NUDIX family)
MGEDNKAIFSACVFVRNTCSNKVLLIHHKKANLWLPPGGDLKPGESPPAGAARELNEETGIEPTNLIWPPTYYHALIDPFAPWGFLGYEEHIFNKGGSIGRIRHCNFIFLADSNTPELPLVKMNDEAIEYRWVDSVPKPNNDNVIRFVRLALMQTR